MDRNRETRRSNMAASNGLSRRRQRSSSLRDSPEEDGQIELHETVRLRERANKRDRDRDSSNRNKRRRGEKYEGEESTEDSFGDEEDYEAEDGGGPSRILPPNSTSPPPSSSLSNQNHRKILPPPARVPPLKVADEIIAVPVPRKARSACVKRSHDYWSSGNGGFGEDQNHRRPSPSPSPTPMNVSIKKKTKLNGPKTRLPKVSKSPVSSVQEDDIEIEIAEVLFGLKKQSQSSNKDENIDNSWQKLESKDTNGISHDAKSSITNSSAQTSHHGSILPQNNSSISDPFPAPKKKKAEAENSLISVQDGSIASTVKVGSEQPAKMDYYAPKLEKISGSNVESNDASMVAMFVEQKDSKPSIKESGLGDGAATKEKSISPKEESASKLDVDFQDSTVTKAILNVSEVEPQREDKFKIDLMAPPSAASSPEREGFIDLASDPKPLAHNVEMNTETLIKDEVRVEDRKGKKIETVGEKKGLPKHDFEKLNKDSGSVNISRLQQFGQKQQQLPKVNIPKLEKTAQSSPVPLPIMPVAGWPSSLTPMGYMPPFQTIMPMDSNTGSSAVLQQPPQFLPSQPRPKTCATHHYIARNIYLHQQFTKMNHFWPAATGSALLAKPGNLNVMPSTENMILGNPLQGNFPVVNLNSAQDKVQSIANFPGLAKKDKSSEAANFMDTAQRKQHLMLQQAPQPTPAGNLMHGPSFIFPLSQQQATVAAATNQSGLSKSVTSTNNAPSSSNSAAGASATSTALPAVAAAVSFNYPNLATTDAPYLTILPNYPFPISAPVGTPTQALPLINGSFYPSQMFHPQLQQQQPHSQPLVQPARQNTSTSSGSSSSHKQPQTQQPRGAQVSGNNYLTSASMQLQQPQKQHVPPSHQSRKLEAEISRENASSVADNRASHTQRSAYGQNFTMPLQPLNFTFMPPTTSGGGNQGEKQQQQSQLKSLKGGVELVPSQAFAMSFASFNGGNTASNLNFSSMAQNPAIFQSFPDIARQGYQVASASQATQQKNHQLSEGKSGGSSTNPDDGKKGKSPASNGQTRVFDNSARTLNFVSSPVTGNWPPHAITSTAMTTYSPSANSSNNVSQQQLLQQQILQQLQHSTGAAHSKAPTANNLPSSSVAPKFSNNFPVSSQTLIQGNSSSQSPQWKNSARTHPPTSISAAANTTTIKNVSQQQVRAPQGPTQISFAGNSKSALAPQGQQIPTSNQSPSPLVVGSPSSGGNLRSNSTGSKGGSSVPTLQSQQTENSSASTSQKSSPVCGRNVPSILSTCPSHLSELKY